MRINIKTFKSAADLKNFCKKFLSDDTLHKKDTLHILGRSYVFLYVGSGCILRAKTLQFALRARPISFTLHIMGANFRHAGAKITSNNVE